ncbi:MAG: DNA polymerase/3'-5' exonuclease PolX [Patescibacteria group bacterium]
MHSISNQQIHEMLSTIAAIYQLTGKNRFRIVAYQKAAETVETLPRELYSIWQDGKLKELPGFGSSIGEQVDELFKTGKSPHFEQILSTVPPTLPVLMRVPGIGPKKAYKIITEFDLVDPQTVLSDVISLAEQGRLRDLPLFGEKSEKDVLEAVRLYQKIGQGDGRMPFPVADEIFRTVCKYMNTLAAVKRIDAMGSLRRGRETIGDVDISVMAEDEDAKAIIEHFIQIPGKLAVDNAGDKKASLIFPPNVRVDLRIQNRSQYGSMLQYFTGSKQHNIDLREYALKRGYSLNEYGIKDTKTGELHLFSDEEGFYQFLGLSYIEPELREGRDEIAHAQKGTLPELVTVDKIRGDIHIHSSYDIKTSHDVGKNSYKELVDKAVDRGYGYIGFADHNPRQSGLSEQEITTVMRQRHQDIHKELENVNIPYYIGLEVDILPNGELALPETAFAYVDYLVVSIHSAFTKSRAEQTERLLKALSYPKVRVYGHPTGRHIGKREGIDADWSQIYQFCQENRIALEINASAKRLDLPDSMVYEARNYGCIFCIDTDAHAADHMDAMPYGVTVARRGWLESEQVVNSWKPDRFADWIQRGS